MFCALYIPLYLITGGSTFAVSWWVSGIPYDIIHGATNFILCLVLFKPTVNTLFNLKNIYFN
jgi:energy-coupling factor transport system substrate-specific component